MDNLEKSSRIVFDQCFKLKKSETVLILYSNDKAILANNFLEAAKRLASSVDLFQIDEPVESGSEPSQMSAEKMLHYDAIAILTEKSLTHTEAVKNACKNGARVASMPGLTEEMMLRTLPVNYDEMKNFTVKITSILSKAATVRITSQKGTDLSFSTKTRKANGDFGDLSFKGALANLPGGESFIAPLEGTANGIYIIDGSQSGIPGILKGTLKFEVKDGFVIKISGNSSTVLNSILEKFNSKNAYNIAEFGIGTNPNAILTGKVLEDEKVKGTCHIALGNNSGFGGKVNVPVHLDGVMRKPTILVDGKLIMDKGKFLI